MDATRSAKKDGNSPTDEFNYYQDLDNRIDSLMEELRAVRNASKSTTSPSKISEISNRPKKQKPKIR